KLTYKELHRQVCKAANMLKKLGVKKGDRVCIYMPMILELAISVLACARIGSVHSVVFAGFSANSLSVRIKDGAAKVIRTSDGAFRGEKKIAIKTIVDESLKTCPSVEKVIVCKRTYEEVEMLPERDLWWHEEIEKADAVCDPEVMNSEDMLFILYTSGSTG